MSDGYGEAPGFEGSVGLDDSLEAEFFGEDEESTETEENTPAPQKPGEAKASKGGGGAVRAAKSGFGWSDVESIIKFVNTFDAGDDKQRAKLKSAFGVPAKADALAVAKDLHGAAANIAVFKDATGFIDSIIKGKFGLAEVFALISDLSKRDDDYVRDFFRAVNAFLKEEVRYRKNAPLPTLLEGLVSGAQTSLSQEDRKVIDWINDLLAVWPK